MESFMIVYIMIFYLCIFLLVLAVMIGLVIFFQKRLSDSSVFRKALAFIAGTGADLVGLLIVFMVGNYIILENSYLLRDNSMTDEMVQRRFNELEFNTKLTYVLMFLSGILVSILAGYIAGKIARQNEIQYGLATSIGVSLIIVVRLAIPLYLKSQDYMYLTEQNHALLLTLGVVVIIAAVGSAALGGYFALVQRRKKSGEINTTQIVAPN